MDNKCIEDMYSNLMSKIPLFYLYHPLNSVEHIRETKLSILAKLFCLLRHFLNRLLMTRISK